MDAITAQWAWGGSRGEGVKVAVIDSGVDAGHPDVGPIQGYVAISENEDDDLVYDTEPHDDSTGHGTACEGIIRAMAPGCEIYSVKVLGAGLTGAGRVFLAGLRWALENEMHVCNLSLGSKKRDYFGAFHELADRAYFKNVVLVTAANNSPVTSFPSLFSSVVSVASHDVPDPYTFYYNPEPPVEFGAHGIDVRVPWRSGKYRTSTGNSFAAPHISGLVAKILGKHPELTVFQVKTVLRELATNVDRAEVAEPPRLLGNRGPREEKETGDGQPAV
jgi:subtilisin family serine protease